MKTRRIKLIWGASKVIEGTWYLGLFGLYTRSHGAREDGLAVSLRGAMLWGLGLAVSVYLVAMLAVYSVWERNPYNSLGYADALSYPVRAGEIRQKQGQAFIAEGLDLIKANKWMEGAKLLRRGLALYPPDIKARLLLANYCVLTNQRDEALSVLQDGLTADYPGRAYLQTYLDIASQGEDSDTVVKLVDRYYPLLKGAALAAERSWLATQKFAALLATQRGEEALAWSESQAAGAVANSQKVEALLELKRAAEAVALLEQWAGQTGAELKTVRALQVRALREAGRGEEMEKSIEELRALAPGDAEMAGYGIVQRELAGRHKQAGAALDDFIFRFGGSLVNLQTVAEPLARIGATTLFDRVMIAAGEHGYSLDALRVLKVQLAVKQGAWADAARELARFKPKPGDAREQLWYDWMSRLVAAVNTTSDVPQAALIDFFRSGPWQLSMFKPTVAALRRAGRYEAARELVELAEGLFSQSRWVQTQKREIQDVMAPKNQTEHVQKPTT